MLKIKYPAYPKTVKILFAFYILGFTIGTITHITDIINYGIIVNKDVPLWKNIYWTSLTFLDPFAIVLILRSVVPALVVSSLIIVSDVVINTNGFTFERFGYHDDYKIVLQIVFAMYVLITVPVILRCYRVGRDI